MTISSDLNGGAARVAATIEAAEEFEVSGGAEQSPKPRLLVENSAPDRTIAALRDLLVTAGVLYDRGVPVRVVFDKTLMGVAAQPLTADGLVLLSHQVCRPYALKQKASGEIIEADVRLPRPMATMYLDWRGEWRLPVLSGIASAPLLTDDGTIVSGEGYDPVSGMWREHLPDLGQLVPEKPSRADAETALRLIRDTFKTFCFADAVTVETDDGVSTVDIDRPPGKDESAFIAALVTAVCRPSLPLAPGVLFRASPMSGAGAGKGLLARCIAMIAFGREPHAVTAGFSTEELDKRITAELIGGNPVLFLDNLNNTALRSDLLASVITENPARVRVLGRSQMVPVNAFAFVILTGNGLRVSEDLARHFITVEFDARTEHPESRPFTNDIRRDVKRDRAKLLAAALTIWRWGRRQSNPAAGRPLGSFEIWSSWVRDPLIALGCQDPVERIGDAKERDGRRQATAELFTTWWNGHQDRSVAARDLHDNVRDLIDPQGRGRQFIAAQLEKLTGTRIAGLVLTRQTPAGKWGTATYAMKLTDGQGEHRGHPTPPRPPHQPDGPYAPYADGGEGDEGMGGGDRGQPRPEPYAPYAPYDDRHRDRDDNGPSGDREISRPSDPPESGWTIRL